MTDISLQLDSKLPGFLDLTLTDGDLVLTGDRDTRGTNPILNALVQNLRTIAGEYFLNISVGVPYLTELFGQKDVTPAFEAVLQNTILSTPGVLSLVSWSATTNTTTRTLVITFVAQTTAGEVNWSGDVALAATGAST